MNSSKQRIDVVVIVFVVFFLIVIAIIMVLILGMWEGTRTNVIRMFIFCSSLPFILS